MMILKILMLELWSLPCYCLKLSNINFYLNKKFNGGHNPGNIHASVMNLVTHDKEIYLKLEVDTLRNKKVSTCKKKFMGR
jgi:hypothetical protein